ncbi:MAG: HSP90 family protein [Blastocatellia bacterium]|nr:HSP90 family protein [Blastocatellia bacterium]
MDYKFQVNLQGIIDLLSNHLYSGPQVYVRELLQNGVDAIRARLEPEPKLAGAIHLSLTTAEETGAPVLVFEDNGIGLTEAEIHQFLATIGQTSKRDELNRQRSEFIGQFGIGLLSCFLVSDEIVVHTRSAKAADSPTMEWQGRPDGTYSVRQSEEVLPPGTRVRLVCKPGFETYFKPAKIRELVNFFGGLLPYPIFLSQGTKRVQLNPGGAPWTHTYFNDAERREAYLAYGKENFEIDFFDCFELKSEVGKVEGIAFVLPFSPSPSQRGAHRVYLKHMLLSETVDNLLPDWAFFVKCVVNANELRPTASRESFYEDETLELTREALGQTLRGYLVKMARENPKRLQKFIQLHHLSIKALAVYDDEFYRLVIDWLPFETSLGEMTFGDYRQRNAVIRYTPNIDQFRQIAQVAAAQSLCVINAAYTYNMQLLERYAEVFGDKPVGMIDTEMLVQSFAELTIDQQEQADGFRTFAEEVLGPFHCGVEIKIFQPAELPTLFSTDQDYGFQRSVSTAKDVADAVWGAVLDDLTSDTEDAFNAQLCFNYGNTLVRKICTIEDRTVLKLAIQMLYVQALLLGHHPLSSREMTLLNSGLLNLIEIGVDSGKGWVV